jgi:hypothetical protein
MDDAFGPDKRVGIFIVAVDKDLDVSRELGDAAERGALRQQWRRPIGIASRWRLIQQGRICAARVQGHISARCRDHRSRSNPPSFLWHSGPAASRPCPACIRWPAQSRETPIPHPPATRSAHDRASAPRLYAGTGQRLQSLTFFGRHHQRCRSGYDLHPAYET